jgi:hypothetical protein
MRVLRQCKVPLTEVMFITIRRESIHPSKKEVNKAVTMLIINPSCLMFAVRQCITTSPYRWSVGSLPSTCMPYTPPHCTPAGINSWSVESSVKVVNEYEPYASIGVLWDWCTFWIYWPPLLGKFLCPAGDKSQGCRDFRGPLYTKRADGRYIHILMLSSAWFSPHLKIIWHKSNYFKSELNKDGWRQ